MNAKELIDARITSWGLPETSPELAERLERLAALLLDANEHVNLTAARDMETVLTRHVADSLALLGAVKPAGRVLDLGCGGGFPGLPLKLADECGARAVESITMLDSTAKKLAFVSDAAEKLGMTRVETLAARAEDVGRDDSRREKYDLVVSRAVAELPILAELTLPLVRVGGTMAAMRSARELEDMSAAERAVAKLGGRVEGIFRYSLDGRDFAILTVKKLSRVPTRYPRKYAQILKEPLA